MYWLIWHAFIILTAFMGQESSHELARPHTFGLSQGYNPYIGWGVAFRLTWRRSFQAHSGGCWQLPIPRDLWLPFFLSFLPHGPLHTAFPNTVTWSIKMSKRQDKRKFQQKEESTCKMAVHLLQPHHGSAMYLLCQILFIETSHHPTLCWKGICNGVNTRRWGYWEPFKEDAYHSWYRKVKL